MKAGLRRRDFKVVNLDVSGTLSGAYSNGGNTYYVDANYSATSTGGGTAWDDPFTTITAAVAASLAAGGHHDTILVRGTDNQDSATALTSDYAESVTIAASQVGLRIIGCGNSPEGIAWTVGTAEGDILTVYARDCYVANIRFRPNGATSGTAIKLVTAADMTTNPIGFTVENCIFRSTTETALAGISINGTNDVTIRGCKFTSVETGILSVSPGHSVQYRTVIEDNYFDDKCTNGIDIDGRSCYIRNNQICGIGMTIIIRTNKVTGIGQENQVSGHNFTLASAAFETYCSGYSTDCWLGNTCTDTASSAVDASSWVVLGYPQA